MTLSRSEIATIIARLNQDDGDRQREAMEMLIHLGEDSLDPLIASIDFAEPRGKEAIMRILGQLGISSAIPTLMRFTFDARGSIDDSDARALAMQSIMKLLRPEHGPKIFDFLMEMKDDDDTFVRGYAIEALGRIGDRRAIPIVQDALKDKEEFVQERAQIAADQLQSAPQQDSLQSDDVSDQEILQKIRYAQGGERTYYINLLKERPHAFELARQLVQEGGKGALLGLQILQSQNNASARDVVIRHFVGGANTTERAICLRILSQHLKGDGTPDELRVIQQGLNDPDGFVRQAAMAAAAASGHVEMTRQAIKHVEKSKDYEALGAAEALSNGLTPQMKRLLPELRDALHHVHRKRVGYATDEHVQTEAHMLRAINNVIVDGGVIGATEVTEQALKSLRDADQHWPILVSALRLLRDLIGERTLDESARWSQGACLNLSQLLDHPEGRVRARVIDLLKRGGPRGFTAIVPKLERLIYDDEVDTATDIIPLLGRAGGERARRLLQDLEQAQEPDVAEAAQTALRQMRNKQPVIEAKFTRPPE